MKPIDINTWYRKESFLNFAGYSDPIVSMAARLDVTGLFESSKQNGTSFFTDFLYLLMRSVNRYESFRIRLKDGKPVIFDRVDPSFIVIKEDRSINTCRTAYSENYERFYQDNREDIEREKKPSTHHHFNKGKETDVVFVSCLPWVDMISMKNPYDYNDRDSLSIPRVAWGKAVKSDGRYLMGFDIAVHHALVDGFDMSELIQDLQNGLDKWEH